MHIIFLKTIICIFLLAKQKPGTWVEVGTDFSFFFQRNIVPPNISGLNQIPKHTDYRCNLMAGSQCPNCAGIHNTVFSSLDFSLNPSTHQDPQKCLGTPSVTFTMLPLVKVPFWIFTIVSLYYLLCNIFLFLQYNFKTTFIVKAIY